MPSFQSGFQRGCCVFVQAHMMGYINPDDSIQYMEIPLRIASVWASIMPFFEPVSPRNISMSSNKPVHGRARQDIGYSLNRP